MARHIRVIQDGDRNIPWHEVDFQFLWQDKLLTEHYMSLLRHDHDLRLQYLWHCSVWKFALNRDQGFDEETIRLVHEQQDVEFWKDLESNRAWRDFELDGHCPLERGAIQAAITLPLAS